MQVLTLLPRMRPTFLRPTKALSASMHFVWLSVQKSVITEHPSKNVRSQTMETSPGQNGNFASALKTPLSVPHLLLPATRGDA